MKRVEGLTKQKKSTFRFVLVSHLFCIKDRNVDFDSPLIPCEESNKSPSMSAHMEGIGRLLMDA